MNFFVPKEQVIETQIFIVGSDVNHIRNVLRKTIGDTLTVVSDRIKYNVKIRDMTKQTILCDIIEKEYEARLDVKITIFQGLAKADKIEYVVQKCTELGVYEIIPVEMKRSVVKLTESDKEKKLERWKKIAEVASKQSLRNEILKIDKIMSFKNMCDTLEKYDLVILAYEKETKVKLKDIIRDIDNKIQNIAVIIGPEGGLDEEEVTELIDKKAKSVTLGSRILRTETAPVAISAMIMYELDY